MLELSRRRFLTRGAVTLAALAGTAALGKAVASRDDFGFPATGTRLDRMKASPNWSDGVFHNLEPTALPTERRSPVAVWSDFFDDTAGRTPKRPLPIRANNLAALPDNHYAWLGHSGIVLHIEGRRILIDPALGWAFPIPGFFAPFKGARQFKPAHLPPADLLLITHDHYDHLDMRVIKSLVRKVPMAICPLGVGAHLEGWGWSADRIIEVDWFEEVDYEGMKITCLPSQHFSGRTFRRNTTLWCSYMLEIHGIRVWHSGDSAAGGHFRRIAEMFPNIELAFLECGQYNPVDWPGSHLIPAAWADTVSTLAPKSVMGIHNSRYRLSTHQWDAPMEVALKAAWERNFNLHTPVIGEFVPLDGGDAIRRPWWRPRGWI